VLGLTVNSVKTLTNHPPSFQNVSLKSRKLLDLKTVCANQFQIQANMTVRW